MRNCFRTWRSHRHRGDHLLDLTRLRQQTQPEVVHARVVGDARGPLHTRVARAAIRCSGMPHGQAPTMTVMWSRSTPRDSGRRTRLGRKQRPCWTCRKPRTGVGPAPPRPPASDEEAVNGRRPCLPDAPPDRPVKGPLCLRHMASLTEHPCVGGRIARRSRRLCRARSQIALENSSASGSRTPRRAESTTTLTRWCWQPARRTDAHVGTRVVLCKQIDDQPPSIVFFTNYQSRKGDELTCNPHAACVILAHAQPPGTDRGTGRAARQRGERCVPLRFGGAALKLGVWASHQSQPLQRAAVSWSNRSRQRRHATASTCSPPGVPGSHLHWGGFRPGHQAAGVGRGVQGRLHDRAVWTRKAMAGESAAVSAETPKGRSALRRPDQSSSWMARTAGESMSSY